MHTDEPKGRDELTAADALRILQEGDARFCANVRANRDLMQQVSEMSEGQWPFAVVLGCIDSRTSAELIFDQGIGDIFSIRIAGNFLNEDILGSMEFACHVAGAKLVVVLGHTSCGAIKGACDAVELGHLTGALGKLQAAVDAVEDPIDPKQRCSSNASFVDAVARKNVRLGVEGISARSDVLRRMRDEKSIEVVGGMYDVSSGAVSFLDDAASPSKWASPASQSGRAEASQAADD